MGQPAKQGKGGRIQLHKNPQPVRTMALEARKNIQAGKIVARLAGHIHTDPTQPDFEQKFLQPTQVTAALGLLRKVLPDLASMEFKADDTSISLLQAIQEASERAAQLKQSRSVSLDIEDAEYTQVVDKSRDV